MGLMYDERLKPCPICGEKAFVEHDGVDGFEFGWSVGCPKFYIDDGIHGLTFDSPKDEVNKKRLTGFNYSTRDKAIEAWNDRVETGEWRISPWDE